MHPGLNFEGPVVSAFQCFNLDGGNFGFERQVQLCVIRVKVVLQSMTPDDVVKGLCIEYVIFQTQNRALGTLYSINAGNDSSQSRQTFGK